MARQYADTLHIEQVPFELPGYQSLLCWSTRSDTDPGIAWLRARIVEIMQAS